MENTIYVSSSDHRASLWIKNNISQDTIIQAFSDPSAYAIVTFGERQMALGWKLAYKILHDRSQQYQLREQEINEIFKSNNINNVIKLLKNYRINYLYLGKHDKKILKTKCIKFKNYPNIFKKIYSKDDVDIFQINSDSL